MKTVNYKSLKYLLFQPEKKSESSETSEKKGKKQPSENSKKNRTADVPKLPAI